MIIFHSVHSKSFANFKIFNFLVINTNLASYGNLHFRKNFSEKIQKLIRTIDDIQIRNYNIILTERLKNYQHCHQVKLINMIM